MNLEAVAAAAPPLDDDKRRSFAVFAFLLAVATVLHESQLGNWVVLSSTTAVSLAALGLLLDPTSVPRFLGLAAATAASWAMDMPHVWNHWMMLGIVNLCFLLALPLVARGGWTTSALYDLVGPVLRYGLVLVYGFAALAKLNRDFLDPGLSCAASMYGDVVALLPFLPGGPWTASAAALGTVLIEGLLAVLLLFPKTRIAALTLGGAFHTLLALAGHVPFSGFAWALLALFLPLDFPRRIDRWALAFPRLQEAARRLRGSARSMAAYAAVAGAWMLVVWLMENVVRVDPDRLRVWLLVPFLPLTAVLGAAFLRGVMEGGPFRHVAGAFRLAHPVLLAGPLLVVANGFCPYLGLKTQSSFAMYSNLQTEGDQWNHAILPRGMRVFAFQDRLVEIVHSSDRALGRSAADGSRWVYFQFQDHVSRRPETAVTFVLDGRTRVVTRAGDDPVLSERPPRLLRKLLWFRPVPPPARNGCQH